MYWLREGCSVDVTVLGAVGGLVGVVSGVKRLRQWWLICLLRGYVLWILHWKLLVVGGRICWRKWDVVG